MIRAKATIKNTGNHVKATQTPIRTRLKASSGIQEEYLERVIIVIANKGIKMSIAEHIKPAVKVSIIKWAASCVGKAVKSKIE